MKTISAIIVNWNNKTATAGCIRSLLAQDHPQVEIIICDNGSTDGSIEVLKSEFPGVRLIQNGHNLGFGPAVNRGLEAATGEHLIFLNNDLDLDPDCLSTLSRHLEKDPAVGAAIPKILYSGNQDKINSFGVDVHFTGLAWPHLLDYIDTPKLQTYEAACGGIFMFPRAVYEATGGFDPHLFLYHEDHDLSWRIRLLGWRLETVPEAVMRHDYHFNKGTFKYYASEKNRLILLLKHYRIKTLFLLFPALLLVEAAQWVHALTHGWFWLKLKSYLEIVMHLPQLLKQRARIQQSRRISDREITSLHEGVLRLKSVDSSLVRDFLSPALDRYWERVRSLI